MVRGKQVLLPQGHLICRKKKKKKKRAQHQFSIFFSMRKRAPQTCNKSHLPLIQAMPDKARLGGHAGLVLPLHFPRPSP